MVNQNMEKMLNTLEKKESQKKSRQDPNDPFADESLVSLHVKFAPTEPDLLENDAEVIAGNATVRIIIILSRLKFRDQLDRELMTEKIIVDPGCRVSTRLALQQTTVKGLRLFEVLRCNRDVKCSFH